MKTYLYIFCLLLNIWTIFSAKTREGRIVGGHEARPNSHPFMISLQSRFLWARAHVCGGSLLSEYWVVTAGHCLTESWLLRWLTMEAVAGAHNVEVLGPRVQIATVDLRIPHPMYKGGVGANDIGLVRTKTPFIFTKQVQPINLPQPTFKYFDVKSLNLIGWGVLRTTLFFPDLPTSLQEVNVTFVPFDDCRQAIDEIESGFNPIHRDSNICSGPLYDGIAACNGDSGGPLVYYMPKYVQTTESPEDTENPEDTEETNDEENKKMLAATSRQNTHNESVPVILGVVSWGVSPCGEMGAPTVYTKVTSFIDFIRSYVRT